MNSYKYKFSIITAVYKVEQFLAEAIESIIAQDIGFGNVQLILIDDGSPDDSGKICDEFAAKYPENIVVVHKENGGVSSARNMGIELAEGKYINFFDSDDKLTKNTLSLVWDFFEKHNNKTDVVTIPLKFFDGMVGEHPLNYKFKGKSRVVDLNEEWSFIQLSMSSAFFKNEQIKKLKFDYRLAYAEDAKLIQRILLEKQTMGILPKAAYMYRRRTAGEESAIQRSYSSPAWYLPYMKYFQHETIDYALEKCGKVPKFIQYTLMYDIQWRLKRQEIPEGVLTEQEKNEYFNELKNSISYFDDEIISAQKNVFKEHKIFTFANKYNRLPDIVFDDKLYYAFSDEVRFAIEYTPTFVEFAEIKDNVLDLSGYVGLYNIDYKNADIYILANDKRVDVDAVFDRPSSFILGHEAVVKKGFSVKIKLNPKKINTIKVCANINGYDVAFKKFQFSNFAPLSTKYNRSYFITDKKIITYHSDSIIIRKNNLIRAVGRELKVFLQIAKRDGLNGIGAAVLRELLFVYKFFKRKPIWLISDRATVAGDNGEAFFKYLTQNQKQIDARFVVDGRSPDFERLSKIGPVLKRDSFQHKMISVLSEYIVSSHAENQIYNPLRSRVEPFKSFWHKAKFVFLQHGITKNDVSNWLGKPNKNFFGIVTTAKPEYEFFCKKELFGYDTENIWFTGFCRYDQLFDNPQKIISIMPTWRRYLMDKWDDKKDVWTFVPDFEESDFYRFYNSLINDERLINAAKKNGYKIQFFPHPTISAKLDSFDKNEVVTFLKKGTPYKDVFANSSLIITDYSSAAFDFSYLRKPMIYSQFDADTFFAGNHAYTKGYFDDKEHGFGEVETTLEGTVDRIIEYMENGCKLKDFYQKRIENFFAFDDKNNCKRVYEKMIEARKYKK